MLGRIVLITLVGAVPLSVIALAVLILVRAPPPVERSGSADTAASSDVVRIPFSGRTAAWTVAAVTFADPSGEVEVNLQVLDTTGGPAPDSLRLQAVLVMTGHPMPPEPMAVERVAPGAYRVRGRATMPGTWRLRLTLPDGSVEADLQVAGR